MEVRVRYAPSPTGMQHIGGVRTALYNYFYAKSMGGKFILRVEDTDRERYSDESLQDLYDTLNWLGVAWDEGPIVGGPTGPYVQSERLAMYQEYAKKLVEDGKAYYCYCSSKRLEDLRNEQQAAKSSYQGYDRHCSELTAAEREAALLDCANPVIRLKVPREGKTSFTDVIMGKITRKNKDISPDPIILKSDGFPTYHLANVIDDHFMGITHIMRAQEWIPSGPLHVLLYEAFGWEPPVYAHLPMVMGKDGQKLSKRHGDTAVKDFIKKGYLPEAIINYVSLVGWSLDGEREFFTKADLESCFCLENIHVAPGIFDYKKLDWFNGQYIREKSDDEIIKLIKPYLIEAGFIAETDDEEMLKVLAPLVKERMKVLSDSVNLVKFLYSDELCLDLEKYQVKGADKETIAKAFEKSMNFINKCLDDNGTFTHDDFKSMASIAEELNIKVNAVYLPIRLAITTTSASLPLPESISLLGAAKSKERLNTIYKLLIGEIHE